MRHREPWILALVVAVFLAGCATPNSGVEPSEDRPLSLDEQPAGSPLGDSRPRFETSYWMVLEVETASGQPRFVIIDGGRKNGLQRGFRGRLIEGGRSIAEIEIVEVYDDGSRARIATELADRITPRTAAEIDVPVDDTR